MSSIAWAAYYPNAVYRSETCKKWSSLPAEGLQLVVVFLEGGRREIYSGGDWYWHYNGAWGYVPSGEWGTWKPPPVLPCMSCVKKGTRIETDAFQALARLAWSDREPGVHRD